MPTALTTTYCEELPFRTLPLELPTVSIRVAASLRGGTYVLRVAAAPKSVCGVGGGGAP